MPEQGEQADVLRALGRYLDSQAATQVEIVNREAFLAVSWERRARGGEQRAYQEHELNNLRAQAREMRQGGVGNPAGSLAELLRTLGQELDRHQVDINTIVQEPGGFRVSGVKGGRYYRELFNTGDLLMAAKRQRVTRGQRRASV